MGAGGTATAEVSSSSRTSSSVGSGSGSNSGSGSGGHGGAGGSMPASDGGDGGNPDMDASDGSTFDCAVEGVPGYCIDTSTCAGMTNHASWPGYCPGAADIECCIPYGDLLCNPDATPRPEPNAGNTTEAPGAGGCPDGMVLITTFCIDKYEGTLVEMDTGDAWCPYDNPGTTPMIAKSVAGAVPQGYIDQVQAGDACTNAGKRLCTDAEWLRACQGPDDTTYPYGNTDEPGVCNDSRAVHPAAEYFGTTSSVIYTMLDNTCIDQIPETVDKTGALTGCVTAEGVFDMMGNVEEWTSGMNGSLGVFRGGYYVDTTSNGPGCTYVTTAHAPTYWDYSTGFRCCADAP
jgi:sulfatase modifying factor 1